MSEQPTELERRLAEKAARTEQKRIYTENWSSCRHDDTRRLGEIGAAVLEECPDCGLVTGLAR